MSTTQSIAIDSSQRLRTAMVPVRLSFTWLGVRKSLSSTQREQAADSFGAQGDFISAGKKLLDTDHAAFRAVTSIKGDTTKYWKDISLPFPEPGVRLIRNDQVTEFDQQIEVFKADLREAVEELERHYESLRESARDRLGNLFNESDYPASLSGTFAIEHDFPSLEVPNYLQQLSPELYQQQCQRVESRFERAVEMAEQTFYEQLANLIDHLTERLSGNEDGRAKVFRDSTVDNLTEFFRRFRHLNIGSSEELEQLVERAESVIRGIQPQQLRDDHSLRQHVATQMSSVQASLDGLMLDQPRRKIQRRKS